jgi:hypothetical protein
MIFWPSVRWLVPWLAEQTSTKSRAGVDQGFDPTGLERDCSPGCCMQNCFSGRAAPRRAV